MIPINMQQIEKRLDSDGSFLEVHSIFYTIQGEGPFTGYPAVFLRLAGCNLQCPSCDTEYTEGRREWAYGALADFVNASFPSGVVNKLVVITGGEPFRQNLTPLVRALVLKKIHVQIETNGTLAPSADFPQWEDDITIVCSPKAGKVHPGLHRFIDAYKYVLSHDSVDIDGLPIRALNHTAAPRVARPHEGYKGPVYLQPMDPKNDGEYMINVRTVKRMCMQHGYILQLQIHKIVGVE